MDETAFDVHLSYHIWDLIRHSKTKPFSDRMFPFCYNSKIFLILPFSVAPNTGQEKKIRDISFATIFPTEKILYPTNRKARVSFNECLTACSTYWKSDWSNLTALRWNAPYNYSGTVQMVYTNTSLVLPTRLSRTHWNTHTYTLAYEVILTAKKASDKSYNGVHVLPTSTRWNPPVNQMMCIRGDGYGNRSYTHAQLERGGKARMSSDGNQRNTFHAHSLSCIPNGSSGMCQYNKYERAA